MRATRFVFVDGIMGAGKTTTAQFLVGEISRGGYPARFLAEGPTREEPEHPLRLATTLPHPRAPWDDVSPDEYLRLSIGRWQVFAAGARTTDVITVCDGLLFHGNLTDLMLMDAPAPILKGYVTGILDALRDLAPVVVYLRPPDLEKALRTVSDERGQEWVEYQLSWKLAGPYATRRCLVGYEGFVQLYRDFRAICDALFASLLIPTLTIAVDGDWDQDRRAILTFLRSSKSRRSIPPG